MGLFVDITKPRAWPPPRIGSQRASDLLAYGYTRDPVGDKFHTAFACLFLVCLPIDTYPTTIATWALFIYSVLRLPSTWRTLTPIYNSTIFRCIVAWTLWSLISILWSSNQDAGLDHAGALRMALLPIVLWPVMRHWKLLLGAFLAGVFFQNLVQLSEFIGSYFLEGQDWLTGGHISNLRGVEKHSGKAAMFMSFASLSWIGVLMCGGTSKKISITCFLLATWGMFATVSMAVAVGYISAIVTFGIVMILYRKTQLRHIVITLIALLFIASLSWFLVGERVVTKTNSAITGIEQFYGGELQASNSTILRLYWWTKTLDEYGSNSSSVQWVFGHGMGSVSSIDFTKKGTKFQERTDHIHNSYIQVLYTQGAVGLTLFVWFLFMLAKEAYSFKLECNWRVLIVCVSGVVMWSATTFFENSQSSGRPFAMVILLGTLIMFLSTLHTKETGR
jgi:O-antigen ligase